MGRESVSCRCGSPDLRDHLAADTLAAGVVARHHAVRRGDDGRSHAALDLWDVPRVDVRTPARARDTPQTRDHGLALLGVAQTDEKAVARLRALPRARMRRCGLGVVALDVALLLEDPRHLLAEPRGRDHDRLVRGLKRVANARE